MHSAAIRALLQGVAMRDFDKYSRKMGSCRVQIPVTVDPQYASKRSAVAQRMTGDSVEIQLAEEIGVAE